MSVTDVAIEKIKEMIVSGELRPGERLPKEADLAQRLGLSRSSLREAVRALSLVRILDVRQGDGTYVTSLESDVLLDAMSFVSTCSRPAGCWRARWPRWRPSTSARRSSASCGA